MTHQKPEVARGDTPEFRELARDSMDGERMLPEGTDENMADDLKDTVIALPRHYNEPTIPPMEISKMQEGIIKLFGLAPEHHKSDFAWSFATGVPIGQKNTLTWPVMALTTTQEIWNHIARVVGTTAFFYSPSDRCMDILVIMQAPAKATLRGYPIRENYHVLQMIDYGILEERWVPGTKFVINDVLPYFQPHFVVDEGDHVIPNLQDMLAQRDKEARMSAIESQVRVVNAFSERFPELQFIGALAALFSALDRLPYRGSEVDRDKHARSLAAQKAIVVSRMEEELCRNTLHIELDPADPEPSATRELIKHVFTKRPIPERLMGFLRKLGTDQDRKRGLVIELDEDSNVEHFVAAIDNLRSYCHTHAKLGDAAKVLDMTNRFELGYLLGGKLSPEDLHVLVEVEKNLFSSDHGTMRLLEDSSKSYYTAVHNVVAGRWFAKDLVVYFHNSPAHNKAPLVTAGSEFENNGLNVVTFRASDVVARDTIARYAAVLEGEGKPGLRSLLLGRRLTPEDAKIMERLEGSLFSTIGDAPKQMLEESALSFYHAMHQVVTGRWKALDLCVTLGGGDRRIPTPLAGNNYEVRDGVKILWRANEKDAVDIIPTTLSGIHRQLNSVPAAIAALLAEIKSHLAYEKDGEMTTNVVSKESFEFATDMVLSGEWSIVDLYVLGARGEYAARVVHLKHLQESDMSNVKYGYYNRAAVHVHAKKDKSALGQMLDSALPTGFSTTADLLESRGLIRMKSDTPEGLAQEFADMQQERVLGNNADEGTGTPKED